MTDAHGAVRVGVTNEHTVEVTSSMTPGHVPAQVISTPSLVSIIEGACRRAVLALLPSGHDTVGTHVCVSHEGVAMVGQQVRVSCELIEIEGRHLVFDVSVDGPRGPVSRGTHRRTIVDTTRFARADQT